MEDLSIDREPYPGQLGTHIREFWTTTGCDTVPDCQPEQPIEALKAIPNGSAATDYDVMVGGKDSGLCWILHKPESLPPSNVVQSRCNRSVERSRYAESLSDEREQ